MFATSASPDSPPQGTLVSQVFARFMPRVASGSTAQTNVVVMAASGSANDDDAYPDLAQRVREVGEW